jgi:DNA adenine methylase
MMNQQMTMFEIPARDIKKNVVNVSSVPQRSPFRYPGGKTWLIPTVRKWLKQKTKARLLIEPFAGGGIVSLTAAFEKLSDQITMIEMDPEIAAVWEIILSDKNKWLADKIFSFDLNFANIKTEFDKPDKQLQDIAFCTILKNRIYHGGILAKGSGMIKNGENGKGLASRWYPKTLHDRIRAIEFVKNRINFITGDAFDTIEQNLTNNEAYFFIDPPYTVAGKRLYTCFEMDHERLFSLAAQLTGKFLLTYDNTSEIRQLADEYSLQYRTIPMKTTHHLNKTEILISDNFSWWDENNNTF